MTKSPITNTIAYRHCAASWLIGVILLFVSSPKFIRELIGFVDALYKKH
jgi:hypothetical protein